MERYRRLNDEQTQAHLGRLDAKLRQLNETREATPDPHLKQLLDDKLATLGAAREALE
jgi:hypothetical protein